MIKFIYPSEDGGSIHCLAVGIALVCSQLDNDLSTQKLPLKVPFEPHHYARGIPSN